MASPSSTLSTLRPDLGGSLEEFDLAMDRQGFIGQRVLPVLDVAKQAGSFGRIPVEQLLQSRDTNRANGGGYSRGSFKFEPDSYATEEHGAEEPVDDRESEMYAEYFDHEVVSAQRALDVVLRNQEIRAAALLFNASTWTGSSLFTSITNEWDDYTNATPINDVEGAVRKVWAGSGIWPNALVINRHVFRNLRMCAQVLDRIAASGAGDKIKAKDVTAQMLAQVFDLEEIIIGGSAKNTANEGQTVAFGKIWSDEYAMVCRVARTKDIKEPCVGRTLHYSADGSQIGGTVETYRDETIRGNVVRVRHDVQEKRMYTECAHLLGNVTT